VRVPKRALARARPRQTQRPPLSAAHVAQPPPRPPRALADAGPRPIDSAHYQWAKDMERRRQETAALGITYAPRPVAAGGAAAQPQQPLQQQPPPPGSGSAWNAGGTWEDREISAKATPMLERAVSTIRMAASDGLVLNIVAVTRCEGAATLIYSRGRAKPGYEYNLAAKWELVHTSDAALSAAGLLELYDIADSESDVFSRLRVAVDFTAAGVEKSRCEKIVRDASDDLRSAIRTWAEMLKQL
jgi:hypothetical protein